MSSSSNPFDDSLGDRWRQFGWVERPSLVTAFSCAQPAEDDYEEYDLESMDIHIRETYFATSAERGRWLSSPIASRVRPQAIQPMRGHSSPIKSLVDSFPLSRHLASRSIDDRIIPSLSEDRDEDVRCSSPLPPSSPLSSPMSNISFFNDSVVDPHSNSNDCQSLIGTPELSVSSTTCTSPVESTCRPTLASPTYTPCHSPIPFISRYTGPCSPGSIDGLLSPLSQFELDLPEAEPSKLPLSDTVNKPYPGQHAPSLGVAGERQDGETDPDCEPFNVPQDTAGGPRSNKQAKKSTGAATDKSGVRRTRKRVAPRLSPGAKRKRESECRLPNHSERPSKKFKSSSRREGPSARSLTGRAGTSKAPARLSVEGEASKSGQTSPRSATDPVNDEFHASLTGMVIEALATSRATSMDASTLYLVIIQAHPLLAAERSKGEFLMDIAEVLEAGRSRYGMFEKVDGSGEGSRHRELESRWFYVPERDEDQERASLISAIMPRQKRSETKKYKQYYYRPLGKISRWDPEDAP